MAETYKILVIKTEFNSFEYIERILAKAGNEVIGTSDHDEFLNYLRMNGIDIVLLPWDIKTFEGEHFVKEVRKINEHPPLVIMVLPIDSDEAKEFALYSGVDEFVTLPLNLDELLSSIFGGMAKKNQKPPDLSDQLYSRSIEAKGKFPVFALSAGSGGPSIMFELFNKIPADANAAFFIIQQGPVWFTELFAQKLDETASLDVMPGMNGIKVEPGNIYIATGDKNMTVDKDLTIKRTRVPAGSFSQPSADTMFTSVAETFGNLCTGIFISGNSADGAAGLGRIASVNGKVIIRKPQKKEPAIVIDSIKSSGLDFKFLPESQIHTEIMSIIKGR